MKYPVKDRALFALKSGGMTRQELADVVGVSYKTLSHSDYLPKWLRQGVVLEVDRFKKGGCWVGVLTLAEGVEVRDLPPEAFAGRLRPEEEDEAQGLDRRRAKERQMLADLVATSKAAGVPAIAIVEPLMAAMMGYREAA